MSSAIQSEEAVSCKQVVFSYDGKKNALRGIDLAVKPGEFVAVLGGNGSGKSTFAKQINALYVPDAGTVTVAGYDTGDSENIFLVREHAGLVFQNPDDQMVTSIVEDDVAFGPENLGFAPEEIRTRVDEALAAVSMQRYAKADPNNLSGGQKQRVAVAGILAMRPDIVIFDEPGAMLDPRGRRGIRRVCRELCDSGITVILITHFMQEALLADRVVVMHEGRIALEGSPSEVFSQEDRLVELDLEVPLSVQLAHALQARGIAVSTTTKLDDLKEELCQLYSSK